MQATFKIVLPLVLFGLLGCVEQAPTPTPEAGGKPAGAKTAEPAKKAAPAKKAEPTKSTKAEGDWSDGDTIPSGMSGVPDIKILKVHKNGSGEACGDGKSASLKYKAMLANGQVIDPGTRPFTFTVGARQAIRGWDVVVAKMRIGDSFTILLPQQLAYGPEKGDLKFDMELLSVR